MSDQFGGISKIQAGRWLRDKRLQKGLTDRKKGYTQAEIAEMVGLAQVNYMTFYESGQTDWRRSEYVERFVTALAITPREALDELGMKILMLEGQNRDAPALPVDAKPAPPGVEVRHLGLVQAMMQLDKGTLRNGGVHRARRVACPLPAALKYNPDDLYVLDVNGDSMTCPDVQKTIPAGSSVLFHAKLEPRNGKIVAAWLPGIGPSAGGMGVLKTFRRKETEGVVLESYNPSGARYPAQLYPDMMIQGVCLGFWLDMPY
ncbi:MAG: hypothetical protein HC933_06525 [Pleurocapsa sp. SU_196_0]|nr:hypothetical protein [Pleurocapsa sp. SU_196_0]